MSDELKQVYDSAGKSGRFFDDTTPVNLYRGRRSDDTFDLAATYAHRLDDVQRAEVARCAGQ
jgi:hypothetical protein